MNRVANLVRQDVTYPLRDEAVVSNVLKVVPGALLDLSTEQQGRLFQTAAAFLREEPEVTRRTTSLEVYRGRHALFTELDATLQKILTPHQRDRWALLSPLWNGFRSGNRSRRTYGLQIEDLDERIVNDWSAHYDIPEEQRPYLVTYARRLRMEAKSVIERHELEGKSLDALDRAAFERVTQEFLAIQLRIERELVANLDDETLRRSQANPPLILWFEDSAVRLYDNVRDRGF